MRNKNRKLRKSKVVSNIIFNIIALISTIVALVFCVYIYKLDMIPSNYLTILFIVIGVIYLLLLVFTLPRKIKTWIKIVCAVFFIIFAFVFGYGIKYTDKTMSTIDKINDELKQKEEYYISVLSSSSIKELKELDSKKIGVYTSASAINSEKAIEILGKKSKAETVKYDDLINMFEDLSDKKIDALLVNDSQLSVLEGELSYLELSLKNIDGVMVPIERQEEIVKIVDVTNTPFNIYIAGGDAYGSINKVMNTDVNMVVSVDPVNHKLLLTSIPRDYYVNLPSKGENAYDKLTHAGYYGIQESILAVEKLLDTDINYYAKVNFSTIEGIVDAIGGVDVESDYKFCRDGNKDKTMCYKKGWNHLTKKTVLPFARERHAFKDGDIQRVKNQQKVLEAVIKKITSSKTIISNYTNILDSVSKNFSTSLDSKSINRLVKMQLSDMRGWTIENQNLVGTSDMAHVYTFPKMNLYIMRRNQDSVDNAKSKIKEFFNVVKS